MHWAPHWGIACQASFPRVAQQVELVRQYPPPSFAESKSARFSVSTRACLADGEEADIVGWFPYSPAVRTIRAVPKKQWYQLWVRICLFSKSVEVEMGSISLCIASGSDVILSKPNQQLPQVTKLLPLLLVVPATSATSERSFSSLRLLKTFLRTTMSQSRLNNLMLLYLLKDYTIDWKAAITEFITSNSERMSTFYKDDLIIFCL